MEKINVFYDRIISIYNQYNNYLFFVEEKRKELFEKRKSIAKVLIDGDDNSVLDIAFDVVYLDKIYSNDLNLIFNNLYHLVSAYNEIEDIMVLPKEVVELCNSYEAIVPKTVFVIDEKREGKERVLGTVDKIKESLSEIGELDKLMEYFKKSIELQK